MFLYLRRSSEFRLAFCAIGIFFFHFYFGVLQEKITRGIYAEKGQTPERFQYTMALVFVLCAANVCYATLISALVLKEGRDETNSYDCALTSLMYLVAKLASNTALKWVEYPRQVIFKSCKPIPVLIFGVLIGRKKYSIIKYLCVLTIVIGIALFMYKDGSTAKNPEICNVIGVGEILLFVSLTCNGVQGGLQERMKAKYKIKSGHLMKETNKWAMIYLVFGLIWSGELWEFISFVLRHPSIIWHLVSASLANAIGEYFIFVCIYEFGSLTCTIITTFRKFLTILGSVILFDNHLTERQWVGSFLVFTGLILDRLFGKSNA